jgi:hypothetical protein
MIGVSTSSNKANLIEKILPTSDHLQVKGAWFW